MSCTVEKPLKQVDNSFKFRLAVEIHFIRSSVEIPLVASKNTSLRRLSSKIGWNQSQSSIPSDRELAEFKNQYSGRVRLLVNETAGAEVAQYLADSFNTKYVADLGLLGKSDEDVFAAAWTEKRVIVTHDIDFLDNRRFPPNRNPGVIRIGPGADGRDDQGLKRCLVIALMIAGKSATWWIGMKLDFTSAENFTIYDGYNSRRRLRWLPHQPAEEWVD